MDARGIADGLTELRGVGSDRIRVSVYRARTNVFSAGRDQGRVY